MMGPDVRCLRWDHHFERTDTPMCFQGSIKEDELKTLPTIVIGDDVWIGARVIITKGRIIGRGSVLAAGSVVTKDVSEFTVIGGNPAKITRLRKTME